MDPVVTPVQRLEAVAVARGWRLRWREGPAPECPSLVLTELAIPRVTGPIPVWSVHSADVDGRSSCADAVLRALAAAPPADRV